MQEATQVGDSHEALTFHNLGFELEVGGTYALRDGSGVVSINVASISTPKMYYGDMPDGRTVCWHSDGRVPPSITHGAGPHPHDLVHSVAAIVAGEPGQAINPKDAIGSTKLPLHLWPAEATALGCLGMLEGAEKYGRNNFIAGDGVIASIYVDAAKRHLDAWFAGEEVSHDSGSPHLGNALATIAILVKARAHNRLIDDRDYSPEPNGSAYRRLVESLTPHVGRIKAMFADKKPRHFTIVDVRKEPT